MMYEVIISYAEEYLILSNDNSTDNKNNNNINNNNDDIESDEYVDLKILKAIEIFKMPGEYIKWTVPEGGGGPAYSVM